MIPAAVYIAIDVHGRGIKIKKTQLVSLQDYPVPSLFPMPLTLLMALNMKMKIWLTCKTGEPDCVRVH